MADALEDRRRARRRDNIAPDPAKKAPTLFSKKTYQEDAAALKTILDTWHRKLEMGLKSKKSQFIIAIDAPPILKALNILSSISVSNSRLLSIIRKHSELPLDVIKDLPLYLADPLVIYEREFQGETNVLVEGEKTILVEAETKAGEPILVGIRNGEIKTITPKNHSPHKAGSERLSEEIGKGQVIYARNRKALDAAKASVKIDPAPVGNNRHNRGQGSRQKVLFKEDLVNSHKELPSDKGPMLFSKTVKEAPFNTSKDSALERDILRWQDRHLWPSGALEQMRRTAGICRACPRGMSYKRT
jgi:hypothetical protein